MFELGRKRMGVWHGMKAAPNASARRKWPARWAGWVTANLRKQLFRCGGCKADTHATDSGVQVFSSGVQAVLH